MGGTLGVVLLQLCENVSRFLVSSHSPSSGCGWRRRPPDMEDSCEYIGVSTLFSEDPG